MKKNKRLDRKYEKLENRLDKVTTDKKCCRESLRILEVGLCYLENGKEAEIGTLQLELKDRVSEKRCGADLKTTDS